MSFLNSIPLWGTLAAIGVTAPILIHLWSRRQKLNINWAAMELLKKAMVARSRQVRMEDRLLMFLRCLTLLIVAFALLRPLMDNFDAAKSAGNTGVVIGIDASFSMAHGEPSRFEQAMIKVREILSTIEEGDQVSIVLMSSQPQVLYRSTGYDQGSFRSGLDKTAKVSALPLNLERNLELLLELNKEMKTAVKDCYIITDAQTSDWQALSGQSRETFQAIGDTSRLILCPINSTNSENLLVSDFKYSSGSLQKGGAARFSATVVNKGNDSHEGASIEFLVDGKLKARELLGVIEPGQKKIASFYTGFEQAGDIALTARLSRDKLKTDNERHFIAKIRPSIEVLCIDGDTMDEDSKTKGAFFAMKALGLKHAKETAPIKVTHVDVDGLLGEKLNKYDVLMMFNVGDVNKDLALRIKKYLDNGGGLMTFLGDKTNPEDYNTKFAINDKSILPVKLISISKNENTAEGWHMTPSGNNHALTGLVKKLPPELVSAASFNTLVKSELHSGAQKILTLDNGDPLLVASKDNKVFTFTSSGDRSWNNLPVHPLYMILLQQAATILSSGADTSSASVGEQMKIALPGRLMGDDAELKYPDGEVEPVKVTVFEEKTVVVLNPDTPGVYSIPEKEGKAGAAVALNVNTEESEVHTGSQDNLEQWLGDLPIEISSEASGTSITENRKGRDLTIILLSLGIICFFAQGLLANHMSRRKHAVDGGMVEILQKNRVAASRRS